MGAWRKDDKTHLIVGQANYEAGSVRTPSALHIIVENGEVTETQNLPGILSATGPVALADYKGDGTMGLFIGGDRKSTRLNSSHVAISYAVFCLKKKTTNTPCSSR